MLANYGYKDASGDFFITIDTDNPMREEPVAIVAADKKKKLKYECNPCKPSADRPPLPCVEACKLGAISHSW
jgi:Fe-S-cluster-containing hydrogenase component 2